MSDHKAPPKMSEQSIDLIQAPALADATRAEVDHPTHYQAAGLPEYEVVKILEAFEHIGCHRLQALKYVLRAGEKASAKDPESQRKAEYRDVAKAVFYLQRRLRQLDQGDQPRTSAAFGGVARKRVVR